VGDAPTLEPGAVFAEDYRVVRRLSEGGQGALYVVEQLSTQRRRALKLMRRDLVGQPSLRRRFEIEARVGARIKSDHVVDVIASGIEQATGTPWIVMELLEGQDLGARGSWSR
jgi:serine/threonine-protein kinase